MRPKRFSVIILCCFGLMVDVQAKDIGHPQSNPAVKYPQNSGADNAGLGKISAMIERGELERAVTAITKHLAGYPEDADYLILLARVKQKSGDSAGAIATLFQARSRAENYEDIYLLEAGLLHSMASEDSCHKQAALYNDYKQKTRQSSLAKMDSLMFDGARGTGEVRLESQYDELSNNRGVWHAYSVANKYTGCAGNSLYAGLNTVERYGVSDAEGFVGGGVQAGRLSLELEYRQSRERDVLARNAWSAVLGINTGLSADLMVLASRKNYNDIDTDSIGLGVDYYFSNYQLTLIGAETNYYRSHERLDSSAAQRYSLVYYFAARKYIRFGYITGKELDNDGTANPPYSKIRTLLFTSFLPLSTKTGLLMEFKRHYQSGYFEQNGIRIAVSFKYR